MNGRRILPILVILWGFSYTSYGQEATLPSTFQLIKVDNTTIPVQFNRVYPGFEMQNRPVIELAGTWKKQRFQANDALTLFDRNNAGLTAIETEADGRQLPEYDDSQWEEKDLPAVENQMNAYQTVPEYYQDGVWYRRTFTVADSILNYRAVLKCLAVNYVADVWVNGHYVGWHEGGYTPFAFDIQHKLVSGENSIAIRVDNPAWGSRNDIVPYKRADWFNYTGIIHDLYIEFLPDLSIERVDIVPTGVNGAFTIKTVGFNRDETSSDIQLAYSIFDAAVTGDNQLSSNARDIITNLTVINNFHEKDLTITSDSIFVDAFNWQLGEPVRLWTPKVPNLYVMVVKLIKDDQVLDEYATQFGIRTVDIVGNKVHLNDVPTFFPAVARHEDHPVYGRSIPTEIIYSDLKKVKDVNASMLRTGHYPNHPFTYVAMDRIGIAGVEEIPVWWFDEAEAWDIQNNRRHIHQQMWREMIFRDYNRPSIMLWSAANECYDVVNRKTFIETIHTELDTQYPDGRLVTQSAAADRPGPEDESQFAVDVPGWTMYFGIFYGIIANTTDDTRKFLRDVRDVHPNKPILNTEYGRWSKEDHSEQSVQTNIFGKTYDAFQDYTAYTRAGALVDSAFLMATTWWCLYDWYTHQLDEGYQSMGLFQMNRTTPKEVANNLNLRYRTYALTQPVNTTVEENEKPGQIRLNQNYPNPFNPSTIIDFYLPSDMPVQLSVSDILGRQVAIIADDYFTSGNHQYEFSLKDNPLTTGLYILRMDTPFGSKSQKMMVLK